MKTQKRNMKFGAKVFCKNYTLYSRAMLVNPHKQRERNGEFYIKLLHEIMQKKTLDLFKVEIVGDLVILKRKS